MARRGGPDRIVEKPKDFKNAIKRLLQELSEQRKLLVISCIFAMLGAVLSIMAPNKLSNLTDEISKGLMVDQKAISSLMKKISANLDSDEVKEIFKKILVPDLSAQNVEAIKSSDLSDEDKNAFSDFVSKFENGEFDIFSLKTLPSSVLKKMYTESEVSGVVVSSDDKVVITESMSDNFTDVVIPYSVQQLLFKEFKFNGVLMTSTYQYKILKTLGKIDGKSSSSDIIKQIDKLPVKVRKLVVNDIDFSKIKSISLFLIIMYLLSSIFNFSQSVIMANLSNGFANTLRARISHKINVLPLSYFDKHLSGDILSRVTNDVDTISQTMNQSLASLVSSLTLLLGSLFMMFVTNLTMALTAIGSSFFGFLGMFFILTKSQSFFKARQEALGDLNGHIEEVYSGLNVVKAYNGDEEADRKFNHYNKRVCSSNKKSQFISGLMQPLMGFIGNFGYVAVCIVGALLVMNDKITFGVIVAFMTYIRLFTQPLSQIAQGMTSLQSAAAASERVFEFLDEKSMTNEDDFEFYLKNKDVVGDISFENVSFKYDGTDKMVIKDFTADVRSGQKVAIVGPTGAGKTTMVNLLMKFYDITGGDIKIDGISIKKLSRENIHDLFTMVLQDTWLFDGTIAENIKFNRTDVSLKRVKEVCKEVGLDHFIRTLPNGYNSRLSDSDSVSAGQRQLLTIARGMILDSPFLILDEATSNVDTRTEELVSLAMDKLAKGKTSFIIAHRLSTIKNADIILVVKDGNIVETGSHDELMEKRGFYFSLYSAQFEK